MTHDTIIQTGRHVIAQEAAVLKALAASLGQDFAQAVKTLATCKGHIIVTGMGKSGHVARKIAATFASTGTPATYIHPGEASHGDLGMIGTEDTVIALSRSGETSELGDLITHTQALSRPLIAITATPGSTLANTASHALILPGHQEACTVTNAPTVSTTMMLALGDAIAVALLEVRGFTEDDFKRFHPGGQLGAMLRTVEDLMATDTALPLVQTGASLNGALNQMSAHGFGCVGIINADQALIGILTDGDVRRLLAENRHYDKIDDVMTRTPITLRPEMRAPEALAFMNTSRIMQAFILSEGRPIGIVHMHDFLRAGVS